MSGRPSRGGGRGRPGSRGRGSRGRGRGGRRRGGPEPPAVHPAISFVLRGEAEAVLDRIFGYLDLDELGVASAVCKAWKFTADRDPRWAQVCAEVGMTEALPNSTFRGTFIATRVAESNWTRRTARYSTKTLKGHKDDVWCLEMVGDTHVITGSTDRTLRLYNLEEFATERIFKGHSGGVWSVSVDAAAGVVVSGDTNGFVRVWDLESGELRAEIAAHPAAVAAVHVDGTNLITGAFDNSVAVFDLTTGERTMSLQDAETGHRFHVWSLSYDNGRVASGGWDCVVKIWDLDTGRREVELGGHTGPVRCVQFRDDQVVSGSWDKTVMLWDVAMPSEPSYTLEGHEGPVSDLSADGNKIVTACYDGKARVYDTTGSLVRTIKSHKDAVMCVTANWQRMITGAKDRKVKVLDFAKLE